jgi:hypothetical protein
MPRAAQLTFPILILRDRPTPDAANQRPRVNMPVRHQPLAGAVDAPEDIDPGEILSLPYMTAYQVLHRTAKAKSGDSVLTPCASATGFRHGLSSAEAPTAHRLVRRHGG